MTKDLQPGLGSGALREALAKRAEELHIRMNYSGLPDDKPYSDCPHFTFERCTSKACREARALLSLSSPIEPPSDTTDDAAASWEPGDEVWVCGKFLRWMEDGGVVVQIYPNSQDFFTAEQVKQALIISGHSTKHAVMLKNELNGILAEAHPTPEASSEIRAKMMASFDKVIPSFEMRVQIVSCILCALKS